METPTLNLYDVLGVPPSASIKEIEAACIKLGEQNRPDRNPDDKKAASRFALFELAFTTLTDPVKRAEYDRSIGLYTDEVEDSADRKIPPPSIPSRPNYWKPAGLSLCLLLVICPLALWAYVSLTDHGAIRYRYFKYVSAQDNLDFESSFSYLSPQTKAATTKEAWIKRWSKEANLQVTERFKDVQFSGDRNNAVVRSIITVDGKSTSINSQTWVRINDVWYRDLVTDRPDLPIFSRLHEQQQALKEAKILPTKKAIASVSDFLKFLETNSARGTLEASPKQYEEAVNALAISIQRYEQDAGELRSSAFSNAAKEAIGYFRMAAIDAGFSASSTVYSNRLGAANSAARNLELGRRRLQDGLAALNNQINEVTFSHRSKGSIE